MFKRCFMLLAAFTLIGAASMYASGPSFHPDVTFQGSELKAWHIYGQAEWSAENGELLGKPKQAGGGWLMLDHSYQDVGVYAEFKCTGGCETGVLFRAEKTPDGMKGIFVALSDPELPTYSVTVDSQGKIVERTQLRRGGGLELIAAPPNPNAPGGFRPPVSTVKLPFTPPDSKLRPDDWNQVE